MGWKWLRNLGKRSGGLTNSYHPLTQLGNLLPGVHYRMAVDPEFTVTHLGEGIFELLGYKARELFNKNTMSYLRFLHPEYLHILETKKKSCIQSRDAKKLEYHLYTKTRTLRLVEDHYIGEYDGVGRLIAILGYFKEVKKSSVKLQLLNQLEAYRAAIDVNIISSITDAKGIIIYANENFKRISMYSDEELLGKSHRVVRSDYHSRSFFENLWQTITSGGMWRGEILNRAKDGSLYWVATVIIPVFDETNTVTSYLSLRTLITEQKYSEEQREKYISVLEEIAHLVGHELRGPIGTILGVASLIEKNILEKQDLKSVIGYLVGASKKLDQITRELSARIYAADVAMKENTLSRPLSYNNSDFAGSETSVVQNEMIGNKK